MQNKKVKISIIFILILLIPLFSGCTTRIFGDECVITYGEINYCEDPYSDYYIHIYGYWNFLCKAKNHTFVYDTVSHENWEDYRYTADDCIVYNIYRKFCIDMMDYNIEANTYYFRAVAYCYDFKGKMKDYEDGWYQGEERSFQHPYPLPPLIKDVNPSNREEDVPVNLSELSFRILEYNNETLDYTVTTEPDIGSSHGINVSDGVHTVSISGLEYDAMYFWTINVTDGRYTTKKKYSFFTEHKPLFDPFDEGWTYRKKITIDHNMVDGDLVDFPILISIIDSDIKNKAQSDGDDILFMDDIGIASKFLHEIENFDSSTGELVAWVKISSLSSNVDTIIYMYYGNPNCNNQQFSLKVWDFNYLSVIHMSDETTSTVYDSTSFFNHGYKYKENNPKESEQGIINKCQKHVNNYNYINLRRRVQTYFDLVGDATIEIWLKTTSGSCEYLFHRGEFEDGWIVSLVKTSSDTSCVPRLYVKPFHEPSYVEGSTSLNDGEWHYVVGTIDKSQAGEIDDVRLFVDGEEEIISAGSHGWDGYGIWDDIESWIGKKENKYFPFQDSLDEFRISNCERSDSWIKTSFNTMNDPSGFFSVGPEET